jgi:hypothetical protein
MNSVRTSQEPHYISVKTNRLMALWEKIAVYCENHKKHTNTRTFCKQNAQF